MMIKFHERVICPVYRSYLQDWKRYNVFYGGAGSGKSVFAKQRIILRTLQYDGYNSLIVRKIGADNHYTTFPEMESGINDWGLNKAFKINRSRGAEEITCINGNKVIFRGLDDVEKLKSLVFKTGPLTNIWIEEATQTTHNDFKQLDLRLRGRSKTAKQITLSFNPISALHWSKKHFFDIPLDKSLCSVLKTTYLDNPFLEKEDIDAIERFKTTDPEYYKIYGLGEWGIIGNVVFHNYVIEDFRYRKEDLENVSYGMDFGFNHANTLVSMGWKDDELYIFDEVYLKKKSNPEFIEFVNDRKDRYNGTTITADSAEPDRIKEWNKAGYRVKAAKKGPGSLRMGIDFLRSVRIHVHKTLCPNTANEIQMFQYREDKEGNPDEKFIEINDDCIAAIRYGTEYLWGRFIPKVLINERIR